MKIHFGILAVFAGILFVQTGVADTKEDQAKCDQVIGKFLSLRSKAEDDLMPALSRGRKACIDLVERLQATDLRIPSECQPFRLSRLQTSNARELESIVKKLENPSVFDALVSARADLIASHRSYCGMDWINASAGPTDRDECRWAIGTYLKWRMRMNASFSQSLRDRSSCYKTVERFKYDGFFIPANCSEFSVSDLGGELQDRVLGDSDDDDRFNKVQSTDSVSKAAEKLKNKHIKMLRTLCDRLPQAR
ncbi:MAG: hypothetical protein EBX52_05985 [Proteobacteria bacterium]|nr:hypothetical protein [Pseudomonadota bacterium]